MPRATCASERSTRSGGIEISESACRRLAGGPNGTFGPLALSKIRYKLDLAVIESYYDHRGTGGEAGWLFLPWVAALYFM